MGHKPVGLKLADRLAHRGAADPETRGEIGFGQPVAGQQLAFADVGKDPVIGVLTLGEIEVAADHPMSELDTRVYTWMQLC